VVKFLGLKTALILILVLIVALGTAQLVLANEMSTEGQRVRELEEQKAQLKREVRMLKKDVAALGSLDRIQREAERLGFVSNPQAFEYLSPPKLAQAQ